MSHSFEGGHAWAREVYDISSCAIISPAGFIRPDTSSSLQGEHQRLWAVEVVTLSSCAVVEFAAFTGLGVSEVTVGAGTVFCCLGWLKVGSVGTVDLVDEVTFLYTMVGIVECHTIGAQLLSEHIVDTFIVFVAL